MFLPGALYRLQITFVPLTSILSSRTGERREREIYDHPSRPPLPVSGERAGVRGSKMQS